MSAVREWAVQGATTIWYSWTIYDTHSSHIMLAARNSDIIAVLDLEMMVCPNTYYPTNHHRPNVTSVNISKPACDSVVHLVRQNLLYHLEFILLSSFYLIGVMSSLITEDGLVVIKWKQALSKWETNNTKNNGVGPAGSLLAWTLAPQQQQPRLWGSWVRPLSMDERLSKWCLNQPTPLTACTSVGSSTVNCKIVLLRKPWVRLT